LALILNIETATTNCSVSISKDGKTVFLKEDNNKNYSHAESLHLFIDAVLKESNTTLADIDAIAVSKGPGSYTGLRIGVSAAKGLCFALNKPLISVPTLQALAHQVKVENGFVVSMLDVWKYIQAFLIPIIIKFGIQRRRF
jgi:tRNA threonylcarbamoyladenosine biosynthesis protein TsaB